MEKKFRFTVESGEERWSVDNAVPIIPLLHLQHWLKRYDSSGRQYSTDELYNEYKK